MKELLLTKNSSAILVLFLSELHKGKETEEIYSVGSGPDSVNFPGKETNDAPIRYLFSCAEKEGRQINTVLAIASKKVMDVTENGETAWDHYEQLIKSCGGDLVQVFPVAYDYIESNGNEVELPKDPEIRTDRVFDQFAAKLRTMAPGTGVYIDYTGGLRDTNFLMVALIRYFEVFGFNLLKIVYSNFPDKCIYDLGYLYDMFELISGVDSFLQTANAATLRKVYEKISVGGAATKVLQQIIAFSNLMSLCDIDKLDDTMEDLKAALDDFENADHGDDFYDSLFENLIPHIREKMFLTKGEFDYPEMIKWCLDNRLIQQAMTIYVEKMPKLYKVSNLIAVPPKDHSNSNLSGNEEAVWFFTDVFDYVLERDPNPFPRAKRILKDFLTDVNAETAERAQIISRADRYLQRSEGDDFQREIISKFKRYVLNNFNDDGFSVERKGNIYDKHYKSLRPFLKDIKNQNKFLAAWLIGLDQSVPKTKISTYEAKLHALDLIRDGKVHIGGISNANLVILMQYYIEVKLIRNQTNHAAEGAVQADTQMAEARLQNDYHLTVNREYDTVEACLRAGTEASIRMLEAAAKTR